MRYSSALAAAAITVSVACGDQAGGGADPQPNHDPPPGSMTSSDASAPAQPPKGDAQDAGDAAGPPPPSGSLDSSFGSAGLVHLPSTFHLQPFDLAIDHKGRVVLAGRWIEPAGAADFYYDGVGRLTETGALDGSFAGGAGEAKFIVGNVEGAASGVALQSDGKLLVTGLENGVGTTSDPLTARFLADGTLDGTFGASGMIDDQTADNDDATAVGVALDGKIVVVTSRRSAPQSVVVVRYTASGTLDATFGTSGRVSLGTAPHKVHSHAVAFAPDGSIVVAAEPNVYRLDGSGGVLATCALAATLEPVSVAVDSLGRIAVGTLSTPGGSGAVYRFLPTGAPDTSFAGGVVDPALVHGAYVDLTPDDRIVVAGTGSDPKGSLTLLRLTTDGKPDPSFGTGGRAVVASAPGVDVDAMRRAPDGRIVALVHDSGFTPMLARINP